MAERLVMVKSAHMGDWYLIERAEHDGRQWLERTAPGCMAFRCSSRISDADVEGPAEEMLAIADAIEQRDSVSFRRCAVRVVGDRVFFSSPRNSQRDGETSLAYADELVAQIRRELGTPRSDDAIVIEPKDG